MYGKEEKGMAMQKRERRKMIVYLTAFIFVTAAGFLYKMFFDGDVSGFVKSTSVSQPVQESGPVQSETSEVTDMTTVQTTVPAIDVYICGQVNNPGVYSFVSGVILDDVISKAGGLTAAAASDRINLVYIITSNMSVYIPTEEECVSGYNDDSGILRVSGQNSWKNVKDGKDGDASPSGLVNINTAGKEELMSLPGIGEVLASQIISYREEHPFKTVKEICNVSGIGESKYKMIKDLIVCE